MSSVTGEKIKLSVFGESHGEAVGCVIDGLPAGVKLDFEKINKELKRRAPGTDGIVSERTEEDAVRILSGLLDGVTTGAPLAMLIENHNARSEDYDRIKNIPRPSHSDYPAYVKSGGFNDVRGGGHFSGRLTAPLVFAGAIAKQLLAERGITVGAHIKKIGAAEDASFDFNCIDGGLLASFADSRIPVINAACAEKMLSEIEAAKAENDSVGGEIECAVIGVETGTGSGMFDTVESRLSQLLFAIPAVKGVQFGLGFGFCGVRASAVNDEYEIRNGKVSLISNNNGGVLGGLASGAPIVFSVAVKPTPSIAKPQRSVNLETLENETLVIGGRHDACIVPRAVPVVEAAAALAVLDIIL